jgi:hypothetical protein
VATALAPKYLGDALTDLVNHFFVVVQVLHAHVGSDSMGTFVPEGSQRVAESIACLEFDSILVGDKPSVTLAVIGEVVSHDHFNSVT